MDLRKHIQMLNNNTFKVKFFKKKKRSFQGRVEEGTERLFQKREQHKQKPGCEASEKNQKKLGVAGAYEMVRNLVWAAA